MASRFGVFVPRGVRAEGALTMGFKSDLVGREAAAGSFAVTRDVKIRLMQVRLRLLVAVGAVFPTIGRLLGQQPAELAQFLPVLDFPLI